MGKLFIFGAGEQTRKHLSDKQLLMRLQNASQEIIGIIDNDKEKQGNVLMGFQVYGAEILLAMEWDYIVILSKYYDEIYRQLIQKFNINRDNIKGMEEWVLETYILSQYASNLEVCKQKKVKYTHSFNPQSTVIYTSIIGNYDDLKDPAYVDDSLKYVCFTENRNLHSDIWEMRYIDLPDAMDARHKIREFKLLPHRFFPEYDTSIWVDGCFEILGDLREYMMIYQKYADVLFFPHYCRDCIYDEGAECILQGKEEKGVLIRQMYKYLDEGFPIHNGLVCGGAIVRNHNVDKVIRVMEDWWREVSLFSKRDQISAPYVFWQNEYHYDLCDLYYNENAWLKRYGHRD